MCSLCPRNINASMLRRKMKNFFEFVDRKQRESRKHLQLIEKALKKSGMNIINFIDQDDSYVFIKNNSPDASFAGIRIYEIGDSLAYRVQKEPETEPYGTAYLVDLEEMFNDFMGEGMKEEKAGEKVIDSLVLEINKFFEKSAKAQTEVENTPVGLPAILKTGGTDYSGLVTSKM